MTEVDTERGRIALKLVSKTENGAEITPEEIGARYKEQFPNAGQGGSRPPRDGDRSGGGGRERSGERRRPRAAAVRPLRVAIRRGEYARRGSNVALAGAESAPPLVLLHGLAEALAGRSAALLPAARPRTCAWSPSTCRGFGASPPLPGGGFSLGAVCERVAAAARRARARSGRAMLGPLDGRRRRDRYAAERPGALRALVLLAPAGLIATGAVRPSWRRPRLHAAGRALDARRAPAAPPRRRA